MNDESAVKQRTQALIERAGGPAAVARIFDPPITSQAVSQWVRVPSERCIAIEKATGVSRYEMRPDVFGEPAEAAA